MTLFERAVGECSHVLVASISLIFLFSTFLSWAAKPSLFLYDTYGYDVLSSLLIEYVISSFFLAPLGIETLTFILYLALYFYIRLRFLTHDMFELALECCTYLSCLSLRDVECFRWRNKWFVAVGIIIPLLIGRICLLLSRA